MRVTQPVRQKVWGWPGIVNFALAGTASGFYLLSLLMAALNQSIGIDPGIVAAALVGLGFLGLTLEAGRPLRGRYLLNHMTRSWMSREVLAGIVLILAVILNLIYPQMLFSLIIAASAIGLVVSQGFIVYNGLAVTAWHVVLIPILFITSAFVLGEGLLLLLVSVGMATLEPGLVIIGLICLLLDLVAWLIYLLWFHDDEFQTAMVSLRRSKALIYSVGLGHLLPIMLLIMLFVTLELSSGPNLNRFVAAVIGIAAIAGGVSQKSSIVLAASYLRGMAMSRLSKDNSTFISNA